jgi:uncharacterized protein
MSLVKRHPIITFFVLAYAISWVGWPLYAAGIWPIPFLATGPLIAALIVIPLTQGRAGLRELGSRMIRWRVRWYWYVVAVGLPLAVLLVTVGLNVALGASAPSLAGVGSLSTLLMVFAVRLINPLDGPMGEEPGWRGFALPGLQTTLSPLVTTLILAVLITGWHLPTFLIEGGFQPSIFVGGVVGTVAVTFWYTWLFNRTCGSVLLVLVAHSTQGTIKIGAPWSTSADVAQAILIYAFVASAVAIGLVIFDRKAWRGPAAAEATTPPQAMPPRGAAPVAP